MLPPGSSSERLKKNFRLRSHACFNAPYKAATPEVDLPPVYETRKVKKTKHNDIQVTPLPGVGYGMTADMVTAATEKEAKMRANDLYIKERSEAMNSLEAYVYDLRSRIDEYGGDLKEFGSSELRTALKKELDDTEQWIYSEEADEASKSAFVEKKNQLHNKANPMIYRKREFEERPVRISVLEASIEAYKQVCVPGVEAYAHIPNEDKEKVLRFLLLEDIHYFNNRKKTQTSPLTWFMQSFCL